MFNGVSTSGTSLKLIQIGSGSVTTTGYNATAVSVSASPNIAATNSTAGFVMYGNSAADIISGHMILTLISGNIWISSHTAKENTTYIMSGAGDVALSGALDRVVLTTVNGTDTFDAGSVNILYE